MKFLSFFFNNPLFEGFIYWIKTLWFLWVPLFLIFLFCKSWVARLRGRYLKNLRWQLLEIKLPREIYKSPRAMEVVLNAFHQTRDGNLINKYWEGFLRAWFSLEIAGIDGNVHFFVRTQRFFRNLVEAQFYAQYPDIEIVEVEDYTRAAHFEDMEEWNIWGAEFGLTNDDAFPIRTYTDYGLHETITKEEQKTDPLTSVLEFLGSLKHGEQVWYQFILRATKKDWKAEGKKAIGKILGVSPEASLEEKSQAMSGLSSGQKEMIKAVERNISKLGFDVVTRGMYIARRDVFDFVNVVSLMGVMKQYNALDLNGFKPVNSTVVDYFFKKRRSARKKRIKLNAFRNRGSFYYPYVYSSFVLNSEELATVYHFPGRVAETPTFGRIEAKKSEPPANLPV